MFYFLTGDFLTVALFGAFLLAIVLRFAATFLADTRETVSSTPKIALANMAMVVVVVCSTVVVVSDTGEGTVVVVLGAIRSPTSLPPTSV
jgi:hypothetical protein